jgi:hypothetical protein
VKRRRGSSRSGNHHVTAHGVDSDSCMRMSVPQTMEGTSGRVNCLIVTEGRRHRPWQTGSNGSTRKREPLGTEATGVSEVRSGRDRSEEYAARQLDEVRRSGSGIVKRQVHRSPGPECKLAGHGRGASLEKKPEAHEARVLVSKAVESRSRS